MLGGRTLLNRVIERATPQVERLVLNANGDPARFASFGLPVVADSLGIGFGPLAGVLSGLEWTAEQMPEADYMASFATDTPFIPDNLVAKLVSAVACGAELSCARAASRPGDDSIGLDQGSVRTDRVVRKDTVRMNQTPNRSARADGTVRLQPLFAVWPVALRQELRRALVEEGLRKVDLWMARYRLAVVDFPVDRTSSFFNINEPADLREARTLLSETDAHGT